MSVPVEALFEELKARMPPPLKVREGWVERPHLTVEVDPEGQWEVEWGPLDGRRNLTLQRWTLREALEAVLAHDDAFLREHMLDKRPGWQPKHSSAPSSHDAGTANPQPEGDSPKAIKKGSRDA